MRVNELVVHEIRISFHEQLMKLSIRHLEILHVLDVFLLTG